MQNVEGKTAFITGGASGIGLGIARVFVAQGMKVALADMRREALDEALTYFDSNPGAVHPIRVDITDREGYARAADETEKVFGKIHILINNAGASVSGLMQNATFKDWDYITRTNIGGVVNGLVIVLPRILKHGEEGHVVSTSSSLGLFAAGQIGLYCTTKYAVAGMMEALATDLQGTQVGASVFFPGPFNTNFGISNRANRPDYLKNENAPEEEVPDMDGKQYMDPLEAGHRVLRGIKRNDLFIISHPEFRDGIEARNKALLRAIPQETLSPERVDSFKTYQNVLYNSLYDRQTTPGVPDWE